MDLQSETFQPFRKPNDNLLYINSKSNHPGHIIKNLPKAINRRLSEISSNENLFNNYKKNTKMHCKTQVIEPNLNLRKKINRTKEETIEIEM